ncbi:exopolysaccharide transport family protein [Hyphomicrobium sp. LHD-15]|uniref:GumC family protein n=1 Tax=Hyphomicrobium sp. LHD-15 TaxID=3072142 RepID=UPI00280EE6EC|nr:exopolysaccharide transport family protein [Hyphomicrobium sp. LHD-15]MDQ8697720.1 exopolysaccharide transport family protein [Hyphomicrobium sp. LHD-15]
MPSMFSLAGQDPARRSPGRPGLLDVPRRRQQVLTTTALSVALAAVYLVLTTPTYTSWSRLYVGPSQTPAAGEAVRADPALSNSEAAIVGSDAMLRRVVEVLSLYDDPEFGDTGALSGLRSYFPGRASPDKKALATERLARQVEIARAGNTYILDVGVTSRSPAKAAQINDTLVSLYLAEQINARADTDRRASNLIDSRLGALRDQVQQAEERIETFKTRNQIPSSDGRIADEQQIARLNDELATARAKTADARARSDAARFTLTSDAGLQSLPEILRSPTIERLRTHLAEANERANSLAVNLGPRHPALLDARAQRNAIRARIDAELRRIEHALASEQDVAARREQELQGLIETRTADVSRVVTAQIELRKLEQDAATSREALSAYLTRAKEAREEAQIAVPSARVVSDATPPTKASWPNAWLVLSLGFFGGAALGGLRAFAGARLDTTVRPAYGATAIGQLPLFPVPKFRSKVRSQLSSSRRSLSLRSRPGGAAIGRILDAVATPDGANEAHYRQSILQLLGSFEPDRHVSYPTAIMLLGADRRASPSPISLALAHAAALRGERVLLVDACSASPVLSPVLAPERTEGWPALLAEPAALAAHTAGPEDFGFSLLALARADLGLLKRGERRQLAANLAAASLDYDLVVIDGGVLTTDESASALLPLIDKILIVARNGKTQQANLDHTLHLLAPYRGKVGGVVLAGAVSRS